MGNTYNISIRNSDYKLQEESSSNNKSIKYGAYRGSTLLCYIYLSNSTVDNHEDELYSIVDEYLFERGW